MNSNNNILTCLPPLSTDEATDAKESRAVTPPVLRVLLLEDNVELAELLRLMFEMWGFQPTMAHLGREASRLLKGPEFHLALVDVDLPDTTGFEVVAGALAQGLLQNTKIIFFSGGPSDDRVAMARQFPGSIFVSKPFEMQNLLALIRRMFSDEPTGCVSDRPSCL
ncbi:MAG TPA: response regulator [Terriglobales bacterium]|nr:response regulator [Terriglobales bacterium]